MNRIFIDVREPEEFKTGHIDGAINIPPSELVAVKKDALPALADVDKDTEIIVYCRTGARSYVAAMILGDAGFTNVINGINQDHIKARLGKKTPKSKK